MPNCCYRNPREALAGELNALGGGGKMLQLLPFISEMVRDSYYGTLIGSVSSSGLE